MGSPAYIDSEYFTSPITLSEEKSYAPVHYAGIVSAAPSESSPKFFSIYSPSSGQWREGGFAVVKPRSFHVGPRSFESRLQPRAFLCNWPQALREPAAASGLYKGSTLFTHGDLMQCVVPGGGYDQGVYAVSNWVNCAVGGTKSPNQFWMTSPDDFIPAWMEPTVSSYIEILGLGPNWDSYGAKPPNVEVITRSLLVLSPIMQAHYPPPSVVPMNDGGVQLEWHRRKQDLEITFPSDDQPQFYYKNRETGLESSGLTDDTETLTKLMKEIA